MVASAKFCYAVQHGAQEGFSVCTFYCLNGHCKRAGDQDYNHIWSEGLGGHILHAAVVSHHRYCWRGVRQKRGNAVCQLWDSHAGVFVSHDEPLHCR